MWRWGFERVCLSIMMKRLEEASEIVACEAKVD